MTLTEPWAFLVKLLNFAVVVGILLKFAGKPVKNFLQNRHNSVKEKVDEADRLLKEAENLRSTYEAKLAGLDSEMEAFRRTAVEEAEKEKSRIVAEAHALADRIRQQAHGDDRRRLRLRRRAPRAGSEDPSPCPAPASSRG